MHKMSTSDDRGREPPYKPQVAPPRHRGGNRFRGTVRNPKLALSYSNQGTNGFKEIMEGHKIIFRAIAHMVDTVAEADLREMCQFLEEVEVDLIKVQMSADQGSLVGQFQEMPQDVIIARNQATYHNSVKDAKMMKTD